MARTVGPAPLEVPGTPTENAKAAQEQIDLYLRGGGDVEVRKALMDKNHPRHRAALAAKNLMYRAAAERVPDAAPAASLAAGRAAQAELDAIEAGERPEFIEHLFDPQSPKHAEVNAQWDELHASVEAGSPGMAADPEAEERQYGFHLTDRERRGHDPLPEPHEPMTWDEGVESAGAIERTGAYYDRNHPHHQAAVHAMSEVFERVERGNTILDGGGSFGGDGGEE